MIGDLVLLSELSLPPMVAGWLQEMCIVDAVGAVEALNHLRSLESMNVPFNADDLEATLVQLEEVLQLLHMENSFEQHSFPPLGVPADLFESKSVHDVDASNDAIPADKESNHD